MTAGRAGTALSVIALATVTAGIAAAAPASASTSAAGVSIDVGHGWTHDTDAPLLDLHDIAPGWSQSRDLLVRNNSDAPASLTVAAADIVESENGCTHAEAAVDTTCGDTGGELGHALEFEVFADPQHDGTFESQPRWAGTLYEMTQPQHLSDIAAHAVWGLRVVTTLPMRTGNDVASDTVGFAFRLGLAGDGSTAAQVEGVKVTRPPHGLLGRVAGALPFTGAEISRLVAGSIWLLLGGGAVLAFASIRRRERHAD